jgi:transcriptional regulator with XRE-family HTH domain
MSTTLLPIGREKYARTFSEEDYAAVSSMSIGDALAYIRRKTGLGLCAMSIYIYSTKKSLERWESGERTPSAGKVVEIEEIFELRGGTLVDLLHEEFPVFQGSIDTSPLEAANDVSEALLYLQGATNFTIKQMSSLGSVRPETWHRYLNGKCKPRYYGTFVLVERRLGLEKGVLTRFVEH